LIIYLWILIICLDSQIFPDDVCVDILIERLESSRYDVV